MRGLLATMRNAIAEETSNVRALLFSISVMVLNDLAWIAFWAIFFRKTGNVHGWSIQRLILLQAVLTTAGGLSLGVLSNARRVGAMALDGSFDAVLTLPVRPLAYVLVRRAEASNLGDLVFGLGLFVVAGHPTFRSAFVFLFVAVASAALMTSFFVLTGSLAFFGGRSDQGELGFQSMIMMGSYPTDMFAGAAKVVLYTVIPAAFVATVPARLIESFNLRDAAALFAVTLIFVILAGRVFHVGLRRYSSGSIWTRA